MAGLSGGGCRTGDPLDMPGNPGRNFPSGGGGYRFMKDKRVKVGIVGLGRLGYRHAENLALRILHCELLAVFSDAEEEMKQARAKWGIQYAYTDYEQTLDNHELAAIFIDSPSKF